MAYVSQEMKAKLAPQIKAVLKKYGFKASIAVRHHSTLVVNIKAGKLDVIGNYNETVGASHKYADRFQPVAGSLSLNPYWYNEHFTGDVKAFFDEIIPAMKGPDFFDHSDIQTDYFHCSHYFDVNIGQWDKPYELVK